jgi:hypothetical protein
VISASSESAAARACSSSEVRSARLASSATIASRASARSRSVSRVCLLAVGRDGFELGDAIATGHERSLDLCAFRVGSGDRLLELGHTRPGRFEVGVGIVPLADPVDDGRLELGGSGQQRRELGLGAVVLRVHAFRARLCADPPVDDLLVAVGSGFGAASWEAATGTGISGSAISDSVGASSSVAAAASSAR